MSARDAILGTIRRKLRREVLSGAALTDVQQREREHPRGPVPARAALDLAGRVELFVAMAQEAAATVARVALPDEVPVAVAAYLSGTPFAGGPTVVAGAANLQAMDWGLLPNVEHGRPARNGDRVAVTPAFCAVAETGTLVLLSGPHSPTTLNFLVDVHVVVLAAADILGPYEDAWDRIRARGGLPRTVNFITGPSRSADIEQTLQMGAHGPVSLHIVVVG